MTFTPPASFIPFPQDRELPDPPERFTYPFYYTPHPLAEIAAAAVQKQLSEQTDWQYDFGLMEAGAVGGQGKMFGVLVVRTPDGQLGYLAAFSGKLAESNHLPGFVPPVYDLLVKDGHYKQGEREISAINDHIEALEAVPLLTEYSERLAQSEAAAELELADERKKLKRTKQERKVRREAGRATLPATDFTALEQSLARESIGIQLAYKDLSRAWASRLERERNDLLELTDEIDRLKLLRKTKSNALQHWIFAQYRFLDARGQVRDLPDIFADTVFKLPPAGSGECAAPKLLQYAYQHGLEPMTMAEFWWGQPPASAIRKHRNYYPACRGKCEPILSHMLQGLEVDPNPMLVNPAVGKQVELVYEDAYLVVVNKPTEFLSVPGKHIEDSVYLRMLHRYPEASGPLIVHRLDMSTSGLMLIAKNKLVHKHLQQQFLKRTVKKRYVALVDGLLELDAGAIDLPLRGDLEDRPRQIVCQKHGRSARTNWEKIEERGSQSLVNLWPVTGRTHQLRVHAAHPLGLNASIVGDDLYGQRADRLYLHAEWISFLHPITKNEMILEAKAEFR